MRKALLDCVVCSKVIDKETLLLPALEEHRYVIVK